MKSYFKFIFVLLGFIMFSCNKNQTKENVKVAEEKSKPAILYFSKLGKVEKYKRELHGLMDTRCIILNSDTIKFDFDFDLDNYYGVIKYYFYLGLTAEYVNQDKSLDDETKTRLVDALMSNMIDRNDKLQIRVFDKFNELHNNDAYLPFKTVNSSNNNILISFVEKGDISTLYTARAVEIIRFDNNIAILKYYNLRSLGIYIKSWDWFHMGYDGGYVNCRLSAQ